MDNEQHLIEDPDTLKHWYAYAFQKGQMQGSAYVGYTERRRLTAARIMAAKQAANMDADSVLLGVSYLGRMSRAAFIEGMAETNPQ